MLEYAKSLFTLTWQWPLNFHRHRKNGQSDENRLPVFHKNKKGPRSSRNQNRKAGGFRATVKKPEMGVGAAW